MKVSNLKYLALCGVLGPVLFTIVVLICSGLRPGHSHIDHFISELGATGTVNEELMNLAGFIPTGVLIATFGLSLVLFLPNNYFARIGSTLIITFGIGVVIVGIFSCDPGCPRTGSLENKIHDSVSGFVFLLAIIGILLLGISFRNSTLFKGSWVNYSILTAILSFGILLALINSIESYTLTGMWQRLLLVTIFLWCGFVGIKIFKYHGLNVK